MKYFLIKKALLLSGVSLLMLPFLVAQASWPGAVADPVLWLQTEDLSTASHELAGQLNQLQVFVVYATTTETEEVLWTLSHADTSRLLMTTNRLADLQSGEYLSLPAPPLEVIAAEQEVPQLRTYFQSQAINKRLQEESLYDLLLGQKAQWPAIPAENFSGKLLELVVYDRLLSLQERQQLESYLALKYGISLQQEVARHYLSATGIPYWDALKARAYPNHISGIGSDFASSIQHLRSSSATPSGSFLSIGLQSDSFLCQACYLSWSDNGMATVVAAESTEQDHPQPMQRLWMLQSLDFNPEQKLVFSLDSRQLYSQLPRGKQWYLLLDSSGEGAFQPESTHYLPPDQVTSEGVIYWTDVQLPFSSPNLWHFSFGFLPESTRATNDFFQQVLLSPNPSPDGHFQLRVSLAEPEPLLVSIFNDLGQLAKQIRLSPSRHHFLQQFIPAKGSYHLVLQAGERQYSTTLLIP
ncbi:MAG: T9SS type A sorting domain-containing protein [Bacteroidota bacterium]